MPRKKNEDQREHAESGANNMQASACGVGMLTKVERIKILKRGIHDKRALVLPLRHAAFLPFRFRERTITIPFDRLSEEKESARDDMMRKLP